MPSEAPVVEQDQVADENRRRFQRVRLTLLGRFMLANRREYPCQTVDMSPGSCALIAPVLGAIDERVVAYIDHIGRVEGRGAIRATVVRHTEEGIAVEFAVLQTVESLEDGLATKLSTV